MHHEDKKGAKAAPRAQDRPDAFPAFSPVSSFLGQGMSFANLAAVITGASSGIGWALARALAAQQCRVGLLARRRDRLEALAADIRQAGGTAAVAPASVADRAQTFAAIHSLRDQLGPIDLLIANAGIGTETLLDPVNLDDVEATFQVNVLGVAYAFAAVLPEMLQRGRGHLAAVSSLAAYKGFPGESAYCASKAAVNSYLEGLRIQLRDRGIAVTTICPGFVWTPMVEDEGFRKMPNLMSADEAARRIVRALRRRVKVFNFPWTTTLLVKLTRWLPDWVVALSTKNYKKRKESTSPSIP
jgi:short-subunit dehydrogenase